MEHKKNLISAHHNYLVNRMLSPEFVLGDPDSRDDFYFLADLLLPGESTPRISARIFDEHGNFLLEMEWNRIVKNPGNCSHQPTPDGFLLLYPGGKILLAVKTMNFPKGHLTRINGRLYDRHAKIWMEGGEKETD